MMAKQMKFKKKAAKVKTKEVVETTLPDISVGNGVMIEVSAQGKAGTNATYRAIKKEIAKRKGHKYRVIWLLKTFLVYRVA